MGTARNTIVERFLKRDSDYLLFLDSDQIFKPENLFQRLKNLNVDIAAGISFKKAYPYYPTIYRDYDGERFQPITNYPRNKIIEVDAVGMFCTLIKRKVFEVMESPWFEFKRTKDKKELISEDLVFCRKAKQLGFIIKVDTSLIIPHVGAIIDDRTFQHTRLALNILHNKKNEAIEKFVNELTKKDIERMVDISEEF